MVQCAIYTKMLQKVRGQAHTEAPARLHDKVGEGHDLSAMFSKEALLQHNVVFDNWKMHKDWLDELRDEPERLLGVNAGHPSAKLLLMVARGEVDPNHMVSFGDVLAKPEELGRKSDKDVFIFLTGGMGTEDVAWGYDVYTRAKELGLGKTLSLWEKPHWA